jgi:hypothetical protein
MTDRFLEEVYYVVEHFDAARIANFQLFHHVEVKQDKNLNYICYINGEVYAVALTLLGALCKGVERFETIETETVQG